MLAGAASSFALPCPLVSRPVSRQSRLETLFFRGKTGGFTAEGVGFELGEVSKSGFKVPPRKPASRIVFVFGAVGAMI
jgi:hypothetical protein